MVSKLRWYRPRFTVGAMLVLVTLVAIPLGYVAQRRSWNLRRKAALEVLKSHGVMISAASVAPVPIEMLREPQWWDPWTAECATGRLTHFEFYRFGRNKASDSMTCDEGLQLMVYFPEVRELFLYQCDGATDQGLEVVGQLKDLRHLNLICQGGVRGGFLRRIPESSHLDSIHFQEVDSLSNEELVSLSRLSRLKTLRILRCKGITEESIHEISLPSDARIIVEPKPEAASPNAGIGREI